MANTAAMLDSGASFNVNNFCVASTSVTNNGATITPALKTGCTAASDTIAGTLPTVTVGSCTVSNQNYSGDVTLSPGVYCGNFNFNGSGSLTLNPGLYIFKGVKLEPQQQLVDDRQRRDAVFRRHFLPSVQRRRERHPYRADDRDLRQYIDV